GLCSPVEAMQVSGSSEEICNKGKDQQHKKNKKENLGDASARTGYAAKAQCAGNQRDDEKDESPVKHGRFLLQPPHKEQDDDNDQKNAQNTGGAITPAPRIGPAWDRAD